MTKSGSTALQNALKTYDDGLIAYSCLSRPNHSLPFVVLFKEEPEKYRVLKRNGTTKRQLKSMKARFERELAQDFARTDCDTIFSGEEIGKLFHHTEVEQIVARLSWHYDRVEVIAYVRPFLPFCLSAFQQRVKGGNDRGPEAGIPYYRKTFRAWVSALGKDAITFVKFDRDSFPEGDVVRDFCARTGATLLPTRKIVTNESLSAEGLSMLYCYNRFEGRKIGKAALMREHNNLVRTLRSFGDTPMTFGPGAAAALLASEAEDIDWMEAQAGFGLRDQLRSAPVVFEDPEEILAYGGQQVPRLMKFLNCYTPPAGSAPEQCAALVEQLRHKVVLTRRRS